MESSFVRSLPLGLSTTYREEENLLLVLFLMIKCGICLNLHTIELSQFLIDKRTAPNVNHNIQLSANVEGKEIYQ